MIYSRKTRFECCGKLGICLCLSLKAERVKPQTSQTIQFAVQRVDLLAHVIIDARATATLLRPAAVSPPSTLDGYRAVLHDLRWQKFLVLCVSCRVRHFPPAQRNEILYNIVRIRNFAALYRLKRLITHSHSRLYSGATRVYKGPNCTVVILLDDMVEVPMRISITLALFGFVVRS